MKVISCATHEDGYLPVLRETAKINGFDLIILGMSEKWQGFTWKFKKIKNYIETLNENEFIIFCDAFDVIISNSKEYFLDKIKFFQKDILFSRHSFADSNSLNFYITGLEFYPINGIHINSGVYYGKVKRLLQLYNLMEKENKFNLQDDQLLLTYTLKKNMDFFNKYCDIDFNGDIFFTKFLLDNLNINNVNILQSKSPVFIHGPGNINLDLELQSLKLSSKPIKIEKLDYIKKRVKADVKTIFIKNLVLNKK